MHEAEIKRIVAEAVRQERRAWLILTVALFVVFQCVQVPLHAKSNLDIAPSVQESLKARRLLQETSQALSEAEDRATVEALQRRLAVMAASPAAEVLLAATPSVEINNLNSTNMDAIEPCTCPPGPPGKDAPDFLRDVFTWDKNSGALTISATTIELTGSLVVKGYAGVKQSLFVGGDPSTGSPSTEIAAGHIYVYGDEQGALLTGFSATPNGFRMSSLTVQGELFEDQNGAGQPKRVATKLF